MVAANWIPRGFSFPDGSKNRRLLFKGGNWQIFLTNSDNYVLAAAKELVAKWTAAGIVGENLFSPVAAAQGEFMIFVGKRGCLVSSVRQGPYPDTGLDALAFAAALRETRKIVGDTPLHDAVYLEQISRLLPTYTLTERLDDETVLGTWLSAGVRISVLSFRRLCKLLEWMDAEEVRTVIDEAGFREPPESGSHAKNGSQTLENTSVRDTEKPREKLLAQGERFSLPGRPELETFFNDHVVDIIANEERYRRMGIDFPAAIILHGPPGCGKTFAVERLIEFLDWPSYSIDSGSIGSAYIHETAKKVSEVFKTAIDNAPSVIMIDEMEAFLTDRNAGLTSGTHHVEEVAEFLRRIPDAAKHRVLVIAMTNMIDAIDPAVLRRGRFDHIIEVKMPSSDEVYALLKSLFARLPVQDNVDIRNLAERLGGHPMSDAAFVVKEAGRIAAKNGMDFIDSDALDAACGALPPVKKQKREIGFKVRTEHESV